MPKPRDREPADWPVGRGGARWACRVLVRNRWKVVVFNSVLNLARTGEPTDPEILDNFAYEVRAHRRARATVPAR